MDSKDFNTANHDESVQILLLQILYVFILLQYIGSEFFHQ